MNTLKNTCVVNKEADINKENPSYPKPRKLINNKTTSNELERRQPKPENYPIAHPKNTFPTGHSKPNTTTQNFSKSRHPIKFV